MEASDLERQVQVLQVVVRVLAAAADPRRIVEELGKSSAAASRVPGAGMLHDDAAAFIRAANPRVS